MFVIADPLKDSAIETIKNLKNEGMNCGYLLVIMTSIAKNTAKVLGIDKIKSNIKPVGKAEFIQQLKSYGKKWRWLGMVLTMLLHLPLQTYQLPCLVEQMWP